MSLSKTSNEVLATAKIGKDLSRLVGQFAGTDLDLLPGSKFYEIERGGNSFIKCKDLGLYSGLVGRNIHVNEWIVKKRTPESYIVKYSKTTVVCESDYFVSYKYVVELLHYKNVEKRIFPFRRKIDSSQIMQDLANRHYLVLICNSMAYSANGDFYLEFSKVDSK